MPTARRGRRPQLGPDDDWLGPLHGIPVGIKDIIDVAGWPTRCGSPLRTGHVAERDAAVVTALRDAGAIILGKTVTTEWAGFDPPVTRNPWNLEHTPGGSSSGSAAAVAADMCLAALGTQTGGSIIRPAAFCGVTGLKPGYGELPMEGIAPLSLHLGPPAHRPPRASLHRLASPRRQRARQQGMFSRRWADRDLESWIGAYGLNKTLFVLEGPLLDRMTPEMRRLFNHTLSRRNRRSISVRCRSRFVPQCAHVARRIHSCRAPPSPLDVSRRRPVQPANRRHA
jgi:aspartyl-tRNA(Asn)/glutamyl-tRNA(Gln) amidotransferase subunit A